MSLAVSSCKRSVTVWRPSVRLSCLLTSIGRSGIVDVTYQGAESDVASVHFHPSISTGASLASGGGQKEF